MNILNQPNRFPPKDSEEAQSEESLTDVKKKLETGEAISSDKMKEIKARNLASMRDSLQNPSIGTIINVEQGRGVININTGTVNNSKGKREISSDFFSRQTGFSSSKVPFKGGRL